MNVLFSRRVPLFGGLMVGLLLGLVYTWGIAPVELVNTVPTLLRIDYRHEWIRLAALSYVADGDLERARARLDGLRHEDVADALEALIEDYATSGRSAYMLRRLTELAQALDVYTPAMLVYLQTPGASPAVPAPAPTSHRTTTPPLTPSPPAATQTPSPSASPSPRPSSPPSMWTSTPVTPTSTPTLTPTPSPTPTPPLWRRLRLAGQEQLCESDGPLRVEVIVEDEDGAQVAGVAIWLMWPGGADRAVTGMKPQQGPGYADFRVEPSVVYTLGTSELGMPLVTGLQIEDCPSEGGEEPVLGSWRIVLAPSPDVE